MSIYYWIQKPAPLAVPTDYLNTNKWNRWESKYASGILAAALVVDRQYWRDQDSNSLLQVGDLEQYDGGEIRGLRFGGLGTINFDKPWGWPLFAATHAFDKGFDKDQPNAISDNGTQLVGWVALESTDHSTLLHLGRGLRYSNAREGCVSKSEPEINRAPNFVETPFLDPGNFDSYQAEASLRSGPL